MVTVALGKYYSENEVFAAIREVEGASNGEPAFDMSALQPANDLNGPDLAAQLRAGVGVRDAYLERGDLKPEHLLATTSLSGTSAANGGESKFVAYWWGYELFIDSATTNAIIGVLTAGAAIEGLLSLLAASLGGPLGIGVAILGGVAAALMGVGAGLLTIFNAAGRGIVVRGIWAPPLFYIWSQ